MKLLNPSGEKIDFIVEGKKDSDKTLVLVHGFGVDKNESFNLFVDFSEVLGQHFRIIRFDFTGYGESEGKQVDVNLQKHTHDLKTIIDYVKKTFPGKIYLYAHSLGSFITAMLNPNGIDKIIFGAPPSNPCDIAKVFKARIKAKGGKYNPQGISIYPRTLYGIQKLGPSFWKVIKNFDEHQAITNLTQKTNLLILKPMQDDIAGNNNYEHYKEIKNLTYQEINGNHSFTKPEDRQVLIKKIKQFLLDR
ncbi:MAG: alpha/beta fold hydrolase [Patescibacteria group bacterium]|nr:alpha/beta fold hydrolase [Patescibacteria group bacterium]